MTLPDVVGMPWDQANHILVMGNGLVNVKKIAEPNPAVPAGVVHRQEPEGGWRVTLDQEVRIYYNP
ncbi:PASTA domain-containing protein [Candidatus Hakubella thermalkaliphila]|uniref:PASTA domain-containing protein n=1 Tax=Candidatus Hakubella thermalkaliphila TaxID=2754717 RepID=UPI00159392DD|nr:PASTA domain-containing protein [Candidatus Hakubella thermalkaliphila]